MSEKIILKIKSDCGCPSKNKNLQHIKGDDFIIVKSKPYIEDHITIPINMLKNFLKIIESEPT